MSLDEAVRRVLELAERCTPEADIPRELKEAVRYCVAEEKVWIQPVMAVVYRSKQDPQRNTLFGDRPILLPARPADFYRTPMRLLLKPAGEAALAKLRIDTEDKKPGRAYPSMTDQQAAILKTLLRNDPMPMTRTRIGDKDGVILCEKTIGKEIRCLREMKLVLEHAPKRGYRLTDEGRDLARHLPLSAGSKLLCKVHGS